VFVRLFFQLLGANVKKLTFALMLLMASATAQAGPSSVEIYTCKSIEGKTFADANAMVATFSDLLEKADLQDSYTAHLGFQQIPARPNSVNWLGVSPSHADFGKTLAWFTQSGDRQAFGALYQSFMPATPHF
jgi:hypothetical protein